MRLFSIISDHDPQNEKRKNKRINLRTRTKNSKESGRRTNLTVFTVGLVFYKPSLIPRFVKVYKILNRRKNNIYLIKIGAEGLEPSQPIGQRIFIPNF